MTDLKERLLEYAEGSYWDPVDESYVAPDGTSHTTLYDWLVAGMGEEAAPEPKPGLFPYLVRVTAGVSFTRCAGIQGRIFEVVRTLPDGTLVTSRDTGVRLGLTGPLYLSPEWVERVR